MTTTSLLVGFYIALEMVAVIFAFRAVRSARTPQGSIGWVVFLITTPYLAVPFYAVFGHSRFAGYVNARRDSAAAVEGLIRLRETNAAHLAADDPHARAFQAISRVPVVSGNGVTLLVDGAETFQAIFAAIDAAQRYVLVQFYIFRDDGLGRALKERLVARAAAGVTVRMLYDAIGCFGLPKAYLAELRAAGVDVRDVHALRARTNRFQVNFRNHRKIVVADGKVAFVGGFNVGDEYLGLDPRFGPWRDTHCRVTGPAVSQLQLVFAEDWYWASRDALVEAINWEAGRSPEDRDALVLAAGPGDDFETGTLYFCNAIHAARRRVWIATPYFVPDVDILTALKLAALRGVDVRLLLPDRPDHKVVWLAAFAFFDEVRAAGVQIWRYKAGFMHQKTLVVDRTLAAVGTFNLDNRSCRLNFEVAAIFFDADAADQVAAMLERDFGESVHHETPLSEARLPIRLGAVVARLFAPIL